MDIYAYIYYTIIEQERVVEGMRGKETMMAGYTSSCLRSYQPRINPIV